MAIIDVVKWNASPGELVWKFPSEDLTTATRLIVSTSQEAMVVIGGEATGPFLPGTHILDTGNIPILRHVVNLAFGNRSPYSAEVWFVQKTLQLDLLWGTQDPIPLLDPQFRIPVPVRCFGQFGLKIRDTRDFLVKLVGTHDLCDTQMLSNYFKALIQTRVKSLISSEIAGKGCSVFDINQHLNELSTALQTQIGTELGEFGVKLVNFFVQSVNFPQDDPAIAAIRESLAKRADMQIRGYNYTQERSFDVLQGAAENEGAAGSVAGAGIGLGIGAAVGGAVGPSILQTTSGVLNTTAGSGQTCRQCGAQLPPNAKFCLECGTPQGVVCCGKQLPVGTKFCPECGKALQKQPS